MSVLEKSGVIVRSLNLELEKLKNLKDFTFARETFKHDGKSREMVVVKPRSLSLMAKPENSIGLFLTDENGADVRNYAQAIIEGEYIAKGMSYALEAYGFDQHLERFKNLAERLNTVLSRYDVGDREKLVEYFFDNPKTLEFAANVFYRAVELIGDRTRIGLSLVSVHNEPSEEVLTFDFMPTVKVVGVEPVIKFYQEWWSAEKTKVPKDALIVFDPMAEKKVA